MIATGVFYLPKRGDSIGKAKCFPGIYDSIGQKTNNQEGRMK